MAAYRGQCFGQVWRSLLILVAVNVFVNAASVRADLFSYTGPSPVTIPNGSSTGITLNIVVTSSFQIGIFESLTIYSPAGSQLTGIGDYVATLTKGSKTIDLFKHVGRSASNTVGFGVQLPNTLTFSNVLPIPDVNRPRLVDYAKGTSVPAIVYRPTTNSLVGTGPVIGAPGFSGETITNFNIFEGENVQGTWQLKIADIGPLSFTSPAPAISGWNFSASAVPEPEIAGMVFVVGTVGMATRVLRRRSNSIPLGYT